MDTIAALKSFADRLNADGLDVLFIAHESTPGEWLTEPSTAQVSWSLSLDPYAFGGALVVSLDDGRVTVQDGTKHGDDRHHECASLDEAMSTAESLVRSQRGRA